MKLNRPMSSKVIAVLVAAVAISLFVGGFVGYASGVSSRHISPVEERRATAEGVSKDVSDFFNLLTNEQKNCLQSSLNQNTYNDIENSRRLPSPDEFQKIQTCTGLKSWPPGGFDQLPSGYVQYEWEPDWEVNKK